MKGKRNETAAADEERCRIAGDLIDRGSPKIHPMLTVAQRARLQEALAGAGASGLVRRWRRRVLIPGLTAAALAAVGMLALRTKPLAFDVQGATVGADGWVRTGAGQRAQVRFSDGTSIAIAEASSGQVSARTWHGATFTVDRGRARFDVVHHPKARWLVEAGPFEIAVTGTRFDVDWSPERGRGLAIDLREGSVVVRGALAGAGIPLRAGQRLVADLDRGTLAVVEEGDDAGAGGGARGGAGNAAVAPDRALGGEGAFAASSAASGDRGQNGLNDGLNARAPRGDRAHPTRLAGAPANADMGGSPVEPPGTGSKPAPAPLPPGTSGHGALLEPEPWHPPPVPADARLAAGGAACLGWAPQIRFDRSIERAAAASTFSLAFSHPVLDRTRSWCGAGSLRVDARFDLSGAPNRFGDRPHHAGEALVELPVPVDLSGKTVTVHFFVEGPLDIRFGAQLFAVNRPAAGGAKWVGGGFTPDLTTGRWWTLTHTFEQENRLFEGGTSPVDRVDTLTLQVYAIGRDRVWTGRVFIDDVGWQ